MSDEFQGRFSIFPAQEKKSEKSPDHTGAIELPLDQAMKFAEWVTAQPGEADWKGEQVIKIRLAGWSKEMKDGRAYVSGFVSPPMAQQNTANTAAETDLF